MGVLRHVSQRLGEVWCDLTGTGTRAKVKKVPSPEVQQERTKLPPSSPPTNRWTGCVWSCCGDRRWNKGLPSLPQYGSLQAPRVSARLPSSKKPSLAVPALTAHPSLLPVRPSHSGPVCHLGGGAAPRTGWEQPGNGAETYPYGLLCSHVAVQQKCVHR